MQRDADIVKALGFVALYAAYVEESIDVVMERLSAENKVTDQQRKLPTSQKIDWCLSVLKSFESDELDDLTALLKDAANLLERRNEVIHGRIYGDNDRSDNLKSGRVGVPDREVTADELYDLAEDLFELQAAIPAVNFFATVRAITTQSSKGEAR